MATITVNIIGRRWADEKQAKEIVTFCDPVNEGVCYETAPCANTVAGEQAAVQAAINVRKAAGLDYPGMPAAPSDVVTVTV